MECLVPCIVYGVQSYHDYLHLYYGHPRTSLYEAKVLEHLVLKTEGGSGQYHRREMTHSLRLSCLCQV